LEKAYKLKVTATDEVTLKSEDDEEEVDEEDGLERAE